MPYSYSKHACLHFSEILVLMYVLYTIGTFLGSVCYCSDLRSDWFEGVFEAVGLLVAVPSGLTRTGEGGERERERGR